MRRFVAFFSCSSCGKWEGRSTGNSEEGSVQGFMRSSLVKQIVKKTKSQVSPLMLMYEASNVFTLILCACYPSLIAGLLLQAYKYPLLPKHVHLSTVCFGSGDCSSPGTNNLSGSMHWHSFQGPPEVSTC